MNDNNVLSSTKHCNNNSNKDEKDHFHHCNDEEENDNNNHILVVEDSHHSLSLSSSLSTMTTTTEASNINSNRCNFSHIFSVLIVIVMIFGIIMTSTSTKLSSSSPSWMMSSSSSSSSYFFSTFLIKPQERQEEEQRKLQMSSSPSSSSSSSLSSSFSSMFIKNSPFSSPLELIKTTTTTTSSSSSTSSSSTEESRQTSVMDKVDENDKVNVNVSVNTNNNEEKDKKQQQEPKEQNYNERTHQTTSLPDHIAQQLSGVRDVSSFTSPPSSSSSGAVALRGNIENEQMNNNNMNSVDNNNNNDDDDDVPVFWHVHKSGGSTLKRFMGICHRVKIASHLGGLEGHDQDTEIALVAIGGNKTDPNRRKQYVNVDTSTKEGLQRAKQLGLIPSRLADLIVVSFLYEAANLFLDNSDVNPALPSSSTSSLPKGKLFALFRHPIERIVSQFHYLSHATWERTYRPTLANMTIADYVRHGSQYVQKNWMTKILSNCVGDPTPQDLEIAREVLRTKFIVGLTKDMEQSIERFEKVFGWKYKINPEQQERCREIVLSPQTKFNANTKKHELPQEGSEAYKLLVEHESLDIQLYDYVEQLFVEQEVLTQNIPDGYRLRDAICCQCEQSPTC